jgi:hypothetical protein
LEDQTIRELSVAWSQRNPAGSAAPELAALLRGLDSVGATVVDGSKVFVDTGDRLLSISANDNGLVVESRRVPEDVVIRREPIEHEQQGMHRGMKSQWSFSSPTDPEFTCEVEGWRCIEHEDEDAAERFALALAGRFGWPIPE